MNPFNIDEVINHIASICSYQNLIILSQINKQSNTICCCVIDHYDKDALLKEFNIIPISHTRDRYMFKIPYFTINQYNQLSGQLNGRVYGKDVIISNTKYIIYNDGICILSENNQTVFKDYKLLLTTFKNLK